MKRLLIAALLAALGAPAFAVLSDVNARLADRGQPLLDNVPICVFELVASSNVTATKPAVNNGFNSNDIEQTAMTIDLAHRDVDVGQQSAFPQYSAQTAMVLSGDENRGSSSTPGTKRVGQTAARYLFGDRFTGDYHPALRPDPHLVKVQVLS